MVVRLSRRRVLLSILALYSLLALFLSLLAVKPAFYGLSTVLGTMLLGTTVLGTTMMLGTTVLSSALFGTTTTVTEAYAGALTMGQMAMSLVAIGLLIFLELSDPSLGRTRRLAAHVIEYRRLPPDPAVVRRSVKLGGRLSATRTTVETGLTMRAMKELRSSWLPVTALLVLLFAIIVAFKIWTIIG